MVVRRIHIGSGANQQFRRFQIIPVGCPGQRRRAIRLRRIHIGLFR